MSGRREIQTGMRVGSVWGWCAVQGEHGVECRVSMGWRVVRCEHSQHGGGVRCRVAKRSAPTWRILLYCGCCCDLCSRLVCRKMTKNNVAVDDDYYYYVMTARIFMGEKTIQKSVSQVPVHSSPCYSTFFPSE